MTEQRRQPNECSKKLCDTTNQHGHFRRMFSRKRNQKSNSMCEDFVMYDSCIAISLLQPGSFLYALHYGQQGIVK